MRKGVAWIAFLLKYVGLCGSKDLPWDAVSAWVKIGDLTGP